MSNSSSIRALVHVACSVLTVSVAFACGGSEPAPQAPPPVIETHDDAPHGVSVSSEIGGLSEEKVDKTFKSALSDFQRCLDDGAKRVEFLGGSVSFFVKINEQGKVDHAHLEKSTMGDRDTEKCMLDSLRSKHWPKPVGGLHGLARKSFDFDPPNDVRAPDELGRRPRVRRRVQAVEEAVRLQKRRKGQLRSHAVRGHRRLRVVRWCDPPG